MRIQIDGQFCGPPGTANGGYLCGLMARALGSWPAEITLRRPIPLEKNLNLLEEDGVYQLFDGDALLAEARTATLDLEVPGAPDAVAAKEASDAFLGHHNPGHPYQRCFVCGPAREAGDGMRIFAGPLGEGVSATPWVPENWMAGDGGLVAPEFILGALDCPGYFAHYPNAKPHALLGRMTAGIKAPIQVGEDLRILGWTIGVEGKKHFVGTALFNAEDVPVAVAKSIWFPIP